MNDIKIDLVYLWVDGSDKEWQKKRDYWAEKLGVTSNPENNNCRFFDNDELKYSLRSVEMYAPWINKIFIITDGQVPKWLDVNHPKIRIVDHKEIMPAECLPCFNSEAIETCLSNIPNLSEHFLYANDDCFFSAPTTASYFFDNKGNPIVDVRNRSWKRCSNMCMTNIKYTFDFFKKKYNINQKLKTVEPAHCIDAFTKSSYDWCKREFEAEFKKVLKYKFRTPKSVQRIIFSLYMIQNNLGKMRLNPQFVEQEYKEHVDNLYLRIGSLEQVKQKIQMLTPKLLCINDTEFNTDEDRNNIYKLFIELFNKRPSWEKEALPDIKPVSKKKHTLNFAFILNNKNVKYFSVLLQSLIENSINKFNYELLIFENNINEKYKYILPQMCPKNFCLRFFKISDVINTVFSNQKYNFSNYDFTQNYMFLIPLVLSDFDKILYLDKGIIINGDISKIFNIDFDGKQILAAKNVKASKTKSFDESILMFNIANLDKLKYAANIVHNRNKKNVHNSKGNIIKFIPETYMVTTGHNAECRIFDNNITTAPIIHFTSIEETLSNSDTGSEIFWQKARKTPFYEEILLEINQKVTLNTLAENLEYINLYTKIRSVHRSVLWGASIFLENFISKFNIANENILGIIDKNPNRKGEFLGRYKIYSPEQLKTLNPDEIVITIVNKAEERLQEIKQFLHDNNLEHIVLKTI